MTKHKIIWGDYCELGVTFCSLYHEIHYLMSNSCLAFHLFNYRIYFSALFHALSILHPIVDHRLDLGFALGC